MPGCQGHNRKKPKIIENQRRDLTIACYETEALPAFRTRPLDCGRPGKDQSMNFKSFSKHNQTQKGFFFCNLCGMGPPPAFGADTYLLLWFQTSA
jgi:hypothetical protein